MIKFKNVSSTKITVIWMKIWHISAEKKAQFLSDIRRRGQQRMRWLNSITNSMEMNFSKLQELVENTGNKALLQFATVGLLQFIGLQKFRQPSYNKYVIKDLSAEYIRTIVCIHVLYTYIRFIYLSVVRF